MFKPTKLTEKNHTKKTYSQKKRKKQAENKMIDCLVVANQEEPVVANKRRETDK